MMNKSERNVKPLPQVPVALQDVPLSCSVDHIFVEVRFGVLVFSVFDQSSPRCLVLPRTWSNKWLGILGLSEEVYILTRILCFWSVINPDLSLQITNK